MEEDPMTIRIAGLALLCASLAARAEDLRQVETHPPERDQVLIEGQVEHGGYGGPRISFGRTAGHDAINVGGEAGWIINRRFIVGAAGYGLVTDQPGPGAWAATDNLTVGYGGMMLGYTLLPEKLVHPTITALVGAGGLGLREHGTHDKTDLGDAFFVLEPTATVELNVAAHFRFGVAVSYRWVRGVETAGITNSDLSGVFGSMIVKFGKF
jgi:hypothetical protein